MSDPETPTTYNAPTINDVKVFVDKKQRVRIRNLTDPVMGTGRVVAWDPEDDSIILDMEISRSQTMRRRYSRVNSTIDVLPDVSKPLSTATPERMPLRTATEGTVTFGSVYLTERPPQVTLSREQWEKMGRPLDIEVTIAAVSS